jgi:hypothetical protein
VTDFDMTLEAIQSRPWRVVLLGPRAKKVVTKTWDVTADVDRIAQHVKANGNLGLICHESTGVAVLDADELLAWADMIDTLGQPAAAWTETGRGRLHYFVEWEPGLPAKLVCPAARSSAKSSADPGSRWS